MSQQKDHQENAKPILLSTTITDVGHVSALHLDYPTERNTGGFRAPATSIKGKPIPAYSPIDLSICAIELLLRNNALKNSITNLHNWFRDNTNRIADHYVFLNILEIDGSITTYTVAELKVCGSLNLLLERNAPFTYKY